MFSVNPCSDKMLGVSFKGRQWALPLTNFPLSNISNQQKKLKFLESQVPKNALETIIVVVIVIVTI